MCSWLPAGVFEPKRLWQYPLPSSGVGGISAWEDFVVASSRDGSDKEDLFVCLDAATGAKLWDVKYPAKGQLDYGNSPRATALINDPHVYLLGAFGDFHCVDIDTGETIWKKHLIRDWQGSLPTWGFSGSPIIVDDKLILQCGGKDSALIALDPATGEIVWQTSGIPTAYSSIVPIGDDQSVLVTYDKTSLGGWDSATGNRLWSYRPKFANDFNVPTPVYFDGFLSITTENNGTRIFDFSNPRSPNLQPIGINESLAHDSHTPVLLGDVLIGCTDALRGLDWKNGLKTLWELEDEAFQGYSSVIGFENRVLVATQTGTVVVVEFDRSSARVIHRFEAEANGGEMLAHPAMLGKQLLVRGYQSVIAFRLGTG